MGWRNKLSASPLTFDFNFFHPAANKGQRLSVNFAFFVIFQSKGDKKYTELLAFCCCCCCNLQLCIIITNLLSDNKSHESHDLHDGGCRIVATNALFCFTALCSSVQTYVGVS